MDTIINLWSAGGSIKHRCCSLGERVANKGKINARLVEGRVAGAFSFVSAGNLSCCLSLVQDSEIQQNFNLIK